MAKAIEGYEFKNGFIYKTNEIPDSRTLVVNYLITNKCQLDCIYCIAKDIIDSNEYSEVSIEKVDEIISLIKDIDPLVVVLTGGEPLLSPYIHHAIEELSQTTNLILDTNGILLSEQDLDFFVKHGITIRLSIDELSIDSFARVRKPRSKLKEDAFIILSKIVDFF